MELITVQINGDKRSIQSGLSIGELIDSFQLKRESAIVEMNGVLIKKDVFDATKVTEGDVLEIVRFVGGG